MSAYEIVLLIAAILVILFCAMLITCMPILLIVEFRKPKIALEKKIREQIENNGEGSSIFVELLENTPEKQKDMVIMRQGILAENTKLLLEILGESKNGK